MRICVLGSRGFPNVQGGVETHCMNLYPQLVKKGCEVIAFTRKPYADPAVREYKGVRLFPLSCPKNKYLEAFLHTFYGVLATKKFHADILHIHAIGPSLFVPLARLQRLKVVITNHGPDYRRKKWGNFAKWALRLGERLGSKWSHGRICISESIAADIVTKYRREVAIIPNGVTKPKILKSSDILKKYNLNKGKYILSCGRFVPEKGFHILIDAFKSSKIEGWKLVIAGRADHEDKYSRDLRESAKKADGIILTGFLIGEPLQELYTHAGMFVLPSYYEGLPIVLLEALSYGLSCISSDIEASKNVGLSEDRFFKPGNREELALKIQKYVDKPLTPKEKVRQMDKIAQKYDWENIATRTLDVYKNVKGSGVQLS